MQKLLTIRDAILANAFVIALLLAVTVIWTTSAVTASEFKRSIVPPPPQAEAFYETGRYELLRDSALSCEANFTKLVTTVFEARSHSDWATVITALFAIAMLSFNVWVLRTMRRDMDELRSNSSMQPTGQKRPAAD